MAAFVLGPICKRLDRQVICDGAGVVGIVCRDGLARARFSANSFAAHHVRPAISFGSAFCEHCWMKARDMSAAPVLD